MSTKLELNTTSRAFGSVYRYIQGPGEIFNIFNYAEEYGSNILFVADSGVFSLVRSKIETVKDTHSMGYSFVEFNGECCWDYVHELAKIARNANCDVICALGGGKVLDTIKLVSDEIDKPRIIVPTSASNDAPAANWAALYTPEGIHISGIPVRRCTDLVLVDSEIIVLAPSRLFAAGIGDAYATYYEAMANENSRSPSFLGSYLRCRASMSIASVCKQLLDEKGISAYESVKKHELTSDVEDVIEANILLSGLGFVNAGCAGAHAYHSGISELTETQQFLHGEKVAFGLICQMFYENVSTEIIFDTVRLLSSFDLPVTMSQLGAEISDDNLEIIAQHMLDKNALIYHEVENPSAEKIKSALIQADSFGRKYLYGT